MRVVRQYYKECVPVYSPTVNRSDLAICSDLFSEYVEDVIGKIHDCYIETSLRTIVSWKRFGDKNGT